MRRCIRRKLERIRRGAAPRTLDLFAGCGGLSLGFRTAGFQLLGGLEIDAVAARSYARNFHGDATSGDVETFAKARDITRTGAEDLLSELGHTKAPESMVDVVIGGPPCQSYARVGRAKLREVMTHPEAFLRDPRSNLYLRYLAYVERLQPVALLMENVPDLLNHGGHNIAEEISEVLDEMGYETRYTMLNSVYYGVPQMRERVFLIAYHGEGGVDAGFPEPTHSHELPRGYEGTRQVALKPLEHARNGQTRLDGSSGVHYQPPPAPGPNLPPAVTAAGAIGDLPPITGHLRGEIRRGARRFNNVARYPGRPHSQYARTMRSWTGFESSAGVWDHVIRYLPRDYAIFRRMRPGDQYPEAHRHATTMFEERLAELRLEGKGPRPGTQAYARLKRQTVPPYDPGKFPNKWWKMHRDQPVRTLMAHLGKDGYTHIHYDNRQARTISVREAARLQSFPDGFVFEGTMNPAFRQIGNAVPPLLAVQIAKQMKAQLVPLPRAKAVGG